MRRTIIAAFFGFALALVGRPHSAAKERDEIRMPVRLTVGEANQFMGVLGLDGFTLFYTSDQVGTMQLYSLDIRTGAPTLVHDWDGDATAPRPSPDGKYVLFLFYRDDAAGDACLFDLSTKNTKCLTGADTADLQAFWFPDGRTIGVVQRPGMHEDMVVRAIPVSGGKGKILLTRNLSCAALSADGRFLAYVPVDRLREEVGVAFAMRVGSGIEIRDLQSGETIAFKPELPGMTGLPAFSVDGKWLYFTQYLNDTNGDGNIDGNDHGIIFRVPFDGQRVQNVPEQLTSAEWNCQYPEPARDRLIMTCSYQGSLDVYSLPLDGAIPSDWGIERLEAEFRASRSHWERLLLLSRILLLEKDPTRKSIWLKRMVHLHMEVREFASAIFYAKLAKTQDPEWAQAVLEIIRHRAQEVKLRQGQLSEKFVEGERKRLERLEAMRPSSDAVRAIVEVAKSEVFDVLGEEEAAREAIGRVELKALDDWHATLLVGRRLIERAWLEADREALLEVLAVLSSHKALDLSDRLFFANAYAEVLLRGLPEGQKPRIVEAELKRVEPGSELFMRLELERWLVGLGQKDPEEVRKNIFEIYRSVKDLERRRALVLSTAARAAATDEEYILYEFTNSFVSWLKRTEPERRHAEDLYRAVVLERAYAKWAKGEISDARAWFSGATLQADILEAHIGAIETMLAEGRDVRQSYFERFKEDQESPVYQFVLAYLEAKAGVSEWQAVIERLRKVRDKMPNAYEVHQLWAYVAHQKFLRTGQTVDAEEAKTHYLLALDLAKGNPRALAALYEGLGLLEAELGNHRGAVQNFEKRALWPFLDKEGEAVFCLVRARSLYHAERYEEAAREAARAVELIEGSEGLGKYLPFALDRAAMVHFAAGQYAKAESYYRKWAAIDEGEWNKAKAYLGLGAALLAQGKYEEAIRALQEAKTRFLVAEPSQGALGSMQRPKIAEGADYASLARAFCAHAFRGLGRFDEATLEMVGRLEALKARLRRLDLDEDLLAIAWAHYHLADYAWQKGNRALAEEHIVEGIRVVREFEERTGTVVTRVGNRLLRAYGEIRTQGGFEGARALDEYAKKVFDFMVTNPNPAWAEDRFVIGLFLGVIDASSK